VRRVATFHLVALAWVPFRAGSFANMTDFFASMAHARPLADPFPLGPILLVLVGCATHGLALRFELDHVWRTLPRPAQGIVYGVVIVLVALFSAQTERFIYFQF
jgi:hypothetical protein